MSHLLTCASLNCVVYREHDDHEFECRKPVAGQKYNHHHLLSFFANTTSVSMLSNERAVPNAPLATLVFHGVILDADHHIPLVVMPEVSFVRVHGFVEQRLFRQWPNVFAQQTVHHRGYREAKVPVEAVDGNNQADARIDSIDESGQVWKKGCCKSNVRSRVDPQLSVAEDTVRMLVQLLYVEDLSSKKIVVDQGDAGDRTQPATIGA